jgi:hypothetical protein
MNLFVDASLDTWHLTWATTFSYTSPVDAYFTLLPNTKSMFRRSLGLTVAPLDQLGRQRPPTGLMAGPDARAIVAMEVLTG